MTIHHPHLWCMLNYKGGTAKTTSAAMLVHAMAMRPGRKPIAVDTDPQGSLVQWSQTWDHGAPPVVALPIAGVHRRLWGVVDATTYTDVVIDTPPIEQQGGIVTGCLTLVADHIAAGRGASVIVPLCPSTIELDRIPDAAKALDQLDIPRDNAAVLLNRVKGGRLPNGLPRSLAAREISAALRADGWHVIDTFIGHRERDATAFGGPVQPGTEYVSVLEQLWLHGTPHDPDRVARQILAVKAAMSA